MAGRYYIIDLAGFVFNTGPEGGSADEVAGVLQAGVPVGLPEDLSRYSSLSAVYSWNPATMTGFTVISETSSGYLSLGGSGSFDQDFSRPGTYERFAVNNIAVGVPASSTYTSPYPTIHVRITGDDLALDSISVSAVIVGESLAIRLIYSHYPGAVSHTISVSPLDGATPAFWTLFQGSRETA